MWKDKLPLSLIEIILLLYLSSILWSISLYKEICREKASIRMYTYIVLNTDHFIRMKNELASIVYSKSYVHCDRAAIGYF